MELNDARASAFDAAKYKDGIYFAMKMGTPQDPAERVTFCWNEVRVYENADNRGMPYDMNDEPTSVTPARTLQVPCAASFLSGSQGVHGTAIGDVSTPYESLLLFKEDYDQIKDCDYVLAGGNTYYVKYTEPPFGLFGVTHYTMHLQAKDET